MGDVPNKGPARVNPGEGGGLRIGAGAGDVEGLRPPQPSHDGEGFLNYIAEEKDKRRICGLSPIYILLKAIGVKKGQVLSHSHGEMDGSGSVCSYAGVIFES